MGSGLHQLEFQNRSRNIQGEGMIRIEHESRSEHDFVRLIGRLGAADATDMAEEILEIFEQGTGLLNLEMSELEWIDSGGLSALVRVLKVARKHEGDVILINPNDRVRAVLEMTRLHEIFEIREEDDSANDETSQASGF